jgi:GntR family transcriptional regulator of arabinose operon
VKGPVDRIKIDRAGAIPLHVQLLNQLRQLILSGQWPPDTRLPSEPTLGRRLDISRGTIRQALSNGESEGLIVRVPGKGTFVAPLALERRSGNLIGYVTDDCCDPLQSQVLTSAQSVVTAMGCRVIFANSNGDMEEEGRLLEQMVGEIKVAGIIIWPVAREVPAGRVLQLCQQRAVPLVAVDRTVEGLACDFVTSDNYGGAYAAVEHLLGLGHERIAFLSHPVNYVSTVAERWRGYRDAMRDAGLAVHDPWLVGQPGRETCSRIGVEGDADDHDRDVEEIAHYLKSAQCPTAIFAVNDSMTIRALKAARMLGMVVPEDLSLVGFDDDAIIGALLDLPLTAVGQDAQGIGKRAAELLIERIQGYSGSRREESLPTELKVRGSTVAPPVRISTGETVERDAR